MYEPTLVGPGRYSPPEVVEARKIVVKGGPAQDHISTSYVEAPNLTMRMSIHQFRQTRQRGGIGARNWNSRRMRRRPRLKSEVRRRASFLGRASTGFFRRGADGRRRPTCRRTPPSAARAP